jgi:hypothetical protein
MILTAYKNLFSYRTCRSYAFSAINSYRYAGDVDNVMFTLSVNVVKIEGE